MTPKRVLPKEGGPTFSFASRMERAIWRFTWSSFGAWTPAPLHGWRRVLVRLFGAKIAPTAKIYPGVDIWLPRNLEMKDYACLGPDVNCYCMDKIVLGQYALVSQRAHLCGGTHDVDDPEFELVSRPIHIGTKSWVAAEAFVGPGVTLGDGAVLGARSVTFKDLEPWTVYVGNPARRIRDRRSSS